MKKKTTSHPSNYWGRGRTFIEDNNLKMVIDQSLVDYYFKLIPKYTGAQKSGHSAHITIVRDWEVADCKLSIAMFEYLDAYFFYGPDLIRRSGKHFVVDCFSSELELMRKSLGLSIHRQPFSCFHFTVGFLP